MSVSEHGAGIADSPVGRRAESSRCHLSLPDALFSELFGSQAATAGRACRLEMALRAGLGQMPSGFCENRR